MATEKFQITGNVQFSGKGGVDPNRAQAVLNILQDVMNEFGVVKIDVAINPWQKGPMKVKPKGPIINLN